MDEYRAMIDEQTKLNDVLQEQIDEAYRELDLVYAELESAEETLIACGEGCEYIKAPLTPQQKYSPSIGGPAGRVRGSNRQEQLAERRGVRMMHREALTSEF